MAVTVGLSYADYWNFDVYRPFSSETIQVIWIIIYNLFYTITYTIYNMSHTLMVPLSTRNIKQRGALSVFTTFLPS